MAKAERKPLTFDVDRTPPSPATIHETPSADEQQRQQVGARVSTGTYRRLKARAALQGVTVAVLVERAISEFLANHPD
jgi:hypothetical protein